MIIMFVIIIIFLTIAPNKVVVFLCPVQVGRLLPRYFCLYHHHHYYHYHLLIINIIMTINIVNIVIIISQTRLRCSSARRKSDVPGTGSLTSCR